MESTTPPPAEEPTPEAAAEKERQVRGRALERKVMAATYAELARVGYDKLSFEQVAEVAGVNRTTLYRRWATRRELVQAALADDLSRIPDFPDTGSFRQDLLAGLRIFRDLARDPATGAVMRMLCGGQLHPDIAEFVDRISREKSKRWEELYEKAIARGELPARTDVHLFGVMAAGAVQNLVLFLREPCDDARLETIIDMLFYGVMSSG